MIILVASTKGGVGKTTISTNLAVIRAQNASDVLLIDGDTQDSATEFSRYRQQGGYEPEITCVKVTGREAASEIRKLTPKYDDIFIDAGGRDNTTLRSALIAADVLVVPVQPSRADTNSMKDMDALIEDALVLNEKLRIITFLNRADYNPKLDFNQDAIDQLSHTHHLKLSGIFVINRQGFRRSIAEGLAVTELKLIKKYDQKAVDEIMDLYNEIFKSEVK